MYIIPEFDHTNANSIKIETYNGKVKTLKDALLVLEGTRIGMLPKIKRRLNGLEREFIKPDTIFAWNETECGMKRWTDGKNWSASKVSGPFLIYKELDNDKLSIKPKGLVKQSFSLTTKQHEKLHLISYYVEEDGGANGGNGGANSGGKVPSSDPMLKDLKLNGDIYQEYLLYYDQYLNYDNGPKFGGPGTNGTVPGVPGAGIGAPGGVPGGMGAPVMPGAPTMYSGVPMANPNYYGVQYVQPVPVLLPSPQPDSPPTTTPGSNSRQSQSSQSSQSRGSSTSSQSSQSQSYNYMPPRYSYVQYPMYQYYYNQAGQPIPAGQPIQGHQPIPGQPIQGQPIQMISQPPSQSTSPLQQSQPAPHYMQPMQQMQQTQPMQPMQPMQHTQPMQMQPPMHISQTPAQTSGQYLSNPLPGLRGHGQPNSSGSSASSMEGINIPAANDRTFSISSITNSNSTVVNKSSGNSSSSVSISPTNRSDDTEALKMLDRQFSNEKA